MFKYENIGRTRKSSKICVWADGSFEGENYYLVRVEETVGRFWSGKARGEGGGGGGGRNKAAAASSNVTRERKRVSDIYIFYLGSL